MLKGPRRKVVVVTKLYFSILTTVKAGHIIQQKGEVLFFRKALFETSEILSIKENYPGYLYNRHGMTIFSDCMEISFT